MIMNLSEQMLSKRVRFYEFEGFRLDVAKREINTPKESFPINEKTSEVLQLLLQNAGSVVRKSEFFTKIWDSDEIDETNITQHIYRIRKILGKRDVDTEFIETIPKLGYKFASAVVEVFDEVENGNSREFDRARTKVNAVLPIGSLRESDFEPSSNNEVADSPELGHALSTSQTAGASPIEPRIVTLKVPSKNVTRVFTFAGVTIALVIAAIITFAALELRSTFDDRLSITVLPFRQIGEHQDDKLQLGIADSIITRIGDDEKLTITPTNVIIPFSSAKLSTDHASVFEIGKTLKTDIIIVGTVQRDGDIVRVNMQFFHEKDKHQICTAGFDEAFSNVFGLQDIIAKKAAEKLLEEIAKHEEFAKRY